ncbi:hypothetical protein G5C66_21560 [Nocardioides sp. KC13]|uniref:Uncharacterized protein n=1 Tax=Nocardioides turkmenicus TaxID=2711220 RepID=A0A6M1QZ89_9ACTN|nr:hypothetical protein [Nocardioides sp. KC13]NGN95313.1 hypothetical protein [Nocardioides sp. KC13]
MFDFALLQRQMNAEDPVSVLLRGHLWIESMIVELIRAELPIPEAWRELDRLSWSSKLGLAMAQGNAPDFTSFVVLNRLRNRLAHSPTFEPDLTASMELARAVAADIQSEKNVHAITFDLPDPDTQSPADILREAISTLLEYLVAALTALYEVLANRFNEQAERLRAFIDGLPSSTSGEDGADSNQHGATTSASS